MNDELSTPFWLLSPLAVLGAGLMLALVIGLTLQRFRIPKLYGAVIAGLLLGASGGGLIDRAPAGAIPGTAQRRRRARAVRGRAQDGPRMAAAQRPPGRQPAARHAGARRRRRHHAGPPRPAVGRRDLHRRRSSSPSIPSSTVRWWRMKTRAARAPSRRRTWSASATSSRCWRSASRSRGRAATALDADGDFWTELMRQGGKLAVGAADRGPVATACTRWPRGCARCRRRCVPACCWPRC